MWAVPDAEQFQAIGQRPHERDALIERLLPPSVRSISDVALRLSVDVRHWIMSTVLCALVKSGDRDLTVIEQPLHSS